MITVLSQCMYSTHAEPYPAFILIKILRYWRNQAIPRPALPRNRKMSWLMGLERPEVTRKHVAVQNGGCQALWNQQSFQYRLISTSRRRQLVYYLCFLRREEPVLSNFAQSRVAQEVIRFDNVQTCRLADELNTGYLFIFIISLQTRAKRCFRFTLKC